MNIRDLIFAADVNGLRNALSANRALANEDISLPDNPAKAHPLHRICDGVFSKLYSEEVGLEMAKILIEHGANVNTSRKVGEDSPLTTAASLHCDKIALFYIENGADVEHKGCHGGTVLHWAAWCGREVLVEKLVTQVRDINQRCIDFKATPLFWATHGYVHGGADNRHHQVNCARILFEHGADVSIPNIDGTLPKEMGSVFDF